MNNTMTKEKTSAEILYSQQRNATLITLITFILLVILSIITLFFVPAEDKTIIDNFMMPGLALGAGYSYFLSRRGDHVRGIYVFITFIASACVLYPLAADNVGWQTAIGMLLITTSIANGTLPNQVAGRISAGAFALAIFIVLIEIFVSGVTSNPITTSSIIITVILAIIYIGVILFRFRNYVLQTKLIIAFISLSVLSVGAVAITINSLISNELTNRVGEQLSNLSDSTARSVSEELTVQTNLLQTLALDAGIKNELSQNQNDGDLAELQKLDEEWRNFVIVNNTSAPLIRNVLENPISSTLVRFKENFPAHAEVFVTDVYGANIATTNITSDYYQADEEWWQSAYNTGAGNVYIGQPEFDESSQTLALQVAVPIFDVQEGTVIGVLRSTVNLDILIPSLALGKVGETGHTEIILPNGYEISLSENENAQPKIGYQEAHEDLISLLNQNPNTIEAFHDSEQTLIGQTFLPRIATSAEISVVVTSLNWRVVTLQNRDDALQTVVNVSRVSQLIGLAALAFASLIAVFMTRYLTRPIARLTETAEEISSGNYQAQAQVETPDEIGALAESFNRMTNQINETLVTLEKRVAERTADLEMARLQSDKRANQLVAVGEISKFVNTEQKMDVLLSLITRLVSERFGFYHTGIFLIDETKQFAILQASNSDGGQIMLKRGHRLRLNENSIVGNVAETGQARIALDVGLDAVYFNNPDLPNTRSEMALPLKLRDNIIGVIDVQSEKPGAFMEDDASTLSILADQIAIAIDNARLFSQTQQSLAEVQTLYRQNLQTAWKNFGREEGIVGYSQSLTGGKKLTEPVGTLEIQQVLNRGETMLVPLDQQSNESIIVVPIKLRGQVIGAMRVQSPSQDKKWTANEISLSEAVSERLSLALENARLIQESQRQVIKEQTISEITGNIGSSINLENVLRTAVEELGRSIPGSEVIIKLQDENNRGGNT